MISSKVLDRLSKLMALEGSSAPHEAAAARRAADKLMLQHGVAREEVGREVEGARAREEVLDGPAWQSTWKFVMVTVAADYCGARAFSVVRGGRREIRVEGQGTTVDRSLELVKELMSAVSVLKGRAAADVESDAELADALGSFGRSSVSSYCTGVAYAFAKMYARDRRGSEGASPSSTGLVGSSPAPEEGKIVRMSQGPRARAGDSSSRYAQRARKAGPGIFRGLDPAWLKYGYEMARRLAEVGADGTVKIRGPADRAHAAGSRD